MQGPSSASVASVCAAMRLPSWFPPAAIAGSILFAILTYPGTGDYLRIEADNNPAPFITSLAAGDLDAAQSNFPGMGLTSLLLRVPAAAISDDLNVSYRLGAVLCLLPLILLLIVLDRRMAARGYSPLARLILPGSLLLGPTIVASLRAGHPEDPLTGVLCLLAVLAARDQRVRTAGILLGLAIGAKQWGILAAPLVLGLIGGSRVIDRPRVTTAVIAGALAAVLTLPTPLANPDHYAEVTKSLGATHRVYQQSLWWPISPSATRTIEYGAGNTGQITTYKLPFDLDRSAAMIPAFLIAGGVGLLAWRRRRIDPAALLVGVFAARCAFDPMDLDYYGGPMLIALAWWEGTREGGHRRLPVATFASSVLLYSAGTFTDVVTPTQQWFIWLAGMAPAAWAVAHAIRHPSPEPVAS